MRKSILAIAAGVLLLSGPATLLGGCSAAKSVINANLPDVENPLQLQGRGIKSRVVRNRANFVNVTGEVAPYTFTDRDVPSRESLSSGHIRQRLTQQVVIDVPDNTASPETVRMRNFRLIVTLADADQVDRRMQFDMVVEGEVVFTRTSAPDAQGRATYSTDSVVEFTANLNNEAIDQFTRIIATPNADGSAQNTVSAAFTCEVDDDPLPNGTTEIEFTFGEGSAEVKL